MVAELSARRAVVVAIPVGVPVTMAALFARLAKLWSLIGFSTWHLAPQLILPSALGRERFVAGSAVVGLAMTITAWRSGGLRHVVISHILTDACGVTAAHFRLGR